MGTKVRINDNVEFETSLNTEGFRFYDSKDAPFKVYGVYHDGEKFRRMPQELGDKLGGWHVSLSRNTAGGRVRFRTNSKRFAIYYEGDMGQMPHFAYTGSCGFDMYFGSTYAGTFIPEDYKTMGYERLIEFADGDMKEVTINMPLYSEVDKLYIGLDENAAVEAPTEYRITKPIVYYGSSITQGACASRPGICYEGYITRRFDCDHINLGFSGSARAQVEIAEYIASLDMSIFVYDYDYNADDPEFLESTHERMFKTVRESNPDLPIIMMSRPKFHLDDEELKRVEIINKTYENAKARGDKNVYFIDGRDLCKYCGDEGLVDNIHPTDHGFASMARVLGDLIEENKLL